MNKNGISLEINNNLTKSNDSKMKIINKVYNNVYNNNKKKLIKKFEIKYPHFLLKKPKNLNYCHSTENLLNIYTDSNSDFDKFINELLTMKIKNLNTLNNNIYNNNNLNNFTEKKEKKILNIFEKEKRLKFQFKKLKENKQLENNNNNNENTNLTNINLMKKEKKHIKSNSAILTNSNKKENFYEKYFKYNYNNKLTQSQNSPEKNYFNKKSNSSSHIKNHHRSHSDKISLLNSKHIHYHENLFNKQKKINLKSEKKFIKNFSAIVLTKKNIENSFIKDNNKKSMKDILHLKINKISLNPIVIKNNLFGKIKKNIKNIKKNNRYVINQE